ncbi:porin [Erwinia persicina]|uniref:porin n=1 Tax=Erwinia persicina TaxID=55211 RepID=UPI000E5218A4|nr:porin [Erwinia persicina]AXU97647.1 porin [Erwinia persicina]MBD8167755.1 porin [Erwinia persicina]MCQ4094885.1 porin [Erwinia persicina]MCQ4100150.1 porin [Erwinia persicina]MCQ4103400.1 porin [Erwinia persicina]
MLSHSSFSGIFIRFSVLALLSPAAQADVNLLKKNTFQDPVLAPLSLKMSGSVRPEFIWNRGPDNHGGHDGGSRFRFSADYLLRPGTSIIGFYSLGLDTAHALGLKHHYDHQADWSSQRKMYGGIQDDRFGTLTFGHQYGVYYDTIGVKSDVWDNDAFAGPNGSGISKNVDGGDRPRNSMKYTTTLGAYTLYADWLLPQDDIVLDDDQYYRRKHGSGLGLDYQAAKALVLSASWNQTNAVVKNSGGAQRSYRQQFSGVAATWQPGNWYLVSTATWTHNFVPAKKQQRTEHYFAGSGYGLEAFAGYTFPINKPWLASIQPYVAADTLRLRGSGDYHANHEYLGVVTQLAYGFSVYLEHTFTATSDHDPDQTWLSIYYDF